MCLFVKASWSRSRTLVCRVTFIRRRFIIARKLENYRLNGCHQKRSTIKFSRRKVTCTFPMSHDQNLHNTFDSVVHWWLIYFISHAYLRSFVDLFHSSLKKRLFVTWQVSLTGGWIVPNRLILGWFSNRTGTSVDDGARKLNNWLHQWQSCKLGTGSRV